ncbi:hypothetical protein EIN_054650 [Entamoeba invadens IP1]|uniref:hypothetical protein n=1 Tax=Entamoeba invadens IP1 TaxID=370355 RepID=UPI0002C3E757|nr:hypothetical protein EIN_054650 [Entamoeba invadens IP1]ELP93180.1 hypothetical protein EIN_054650 [Entamoeba invadens IP1]|eukprot:XP_004259951.1 hypothetical protein EIN_054650 [Entamoeba invadens IP1]
MDINQALNLINSRVTKLDKRLTDTVLNAISNKNEALLYLSDQDSDPAINNILKSLYNIDSDQIDCFVETCNDFSVDKICGIDDDSVFEVVVRFLIRNKDTEKVEQIVSTLSAKDENSPRFMLLKKICPHITFSFVINKLQQRVESLSSTNIELSKKIESFTKVQFTKQDFTSIYPQSPLSPQYTEPQSITKSANLFQKSDPLSIRPSCVVPTISKNQTPSQDIKAVTLEEALSMKPAAFIESHIEGILQAIGKKHAVIVFEAKGSKNFTDMFNVIKPLDQFFFVFQMTSGETFGAYFEKSPSSFGQQIVDSRHFVFSIANNYNEGIYKMQWKGNGPAYYLTDKELKIFGLGSFFETRNGILFDEDVAINECYGNTPFVGRKIFSSKLSPKKFVWKSLMVVKTM